MADSDKNIRITPNIGATSQPIIEFIGQGSNSINLKVLDGSTGSIAFEASEGQLFSITNNLSQGTIFSVNDISGIPFIELDASGTVSLNRFVGSTGIGTGTPSAKLEVLGTISGSNLVTGRITVSSINLTGNISASSITASYITSSNISANSLTAAMMNVTTFSSSNISANSLTASLGNFATISGSGVISGRSFISTVATGAPPLTVSSTTVVTNLNSDLLDGQHGNYFSRAADTNQNSVYSRDNRSTDDRPEARPAGFYIDFKSNGTNGLSDGGSYNGQLTFRSYGSGTDFSGGSPSQLAYTANSNWWTRFALTSASWSSWYKFWHSGNDGSGSTLDADLLDGQDGFYYSNYNNLINKPTISDVTITINSGDGLSGTGSFTLNQTSTATITISHADTSTVGNISTVSGVFVNSLTFDTYGHVVGVGTGSGGGSAFGKISVSGQNNLLAASSNDTLTIAAGTNITLSTDNTSNTLTINASAGGTAATAFGVISIPGQETLSADSAGDTFTLVSGTGIDITSSGASDYITINTNGTSSNVLNTLILRDVNGGFSTSNINATIFTSSLGNFTTLTSSNISTNLLTSSVANLTSINATNLTASNINATDITASRLNVTAQTSVTNLSINGFVTFSGFAGGDAMNLNNSGIIGVNSLGFADPGPNEGLYWTGGNLWKIYESPNDLVTNGAGNLQFVRDTTRVFTIYTGSNLVEAVGVISSSHLTTDRITASSINISGNLSASSITSSFINSVTITGSNISTNILTASSINITNFTASNISTNILTASIANLTSINATRLTVSSINATGNISASSLTSSFINTINLTATNISTNILTSSVANLTSINTTRITTSFINVTSNISVSSLSASIITSSNISADNLTSSIANLTSINTTRITASSINITGNLSVSSITASFISASSIIQANSFISTITTGTAPFTVSSTTLVTNLNADLLDGQHGSYYTDYTNLTNKPTISDVTITITGNGGLTGSGSFTLNQFTTASITVSHDDTSTVSNLLSASSVFVSSLTFDTYGHVTALETASVTAGSTSNELDNIYRNAIINGNFDVWQRASTFYNSFSGTIDQYTADRWYSYLNSIGNNSESNIARSNFTVGQSDVPNNPKYFISYGFTGSTSQSNSEVRLAQRIEDVRTFAGLTASLSFWIKSNTTRSFAVELLQSFGTGGSPSADVNAIGSQKYTASSSWQKIEKTVSVPSISGKTLGTADDSFLELNLWLWAGPTYSSRSSGLDVSGTPSGSFDISQIQVHYGDTILPYQPRTYQEEFDMCKRYYIALKSANTNSTYGFGTGRTANTASILIDHDEMRVSPTVIVTASDWRLWDGVTNREATGVNKVDSASTNDRTFLDVTSTTLTIYRPYFFRADGTTNRLLELDAEL